MLWKSKDGVDGLVVFGARNGVVGEGDGSRLRAKFVGSKEARSRHALGRSRLACDTRQSIGIIINAFIIVPQLMQAYDCYERYVVCMTSNRCSSEINSLPYCMGYHFRRI